MFETRTTAPAARRVKEYEKMKGHQGGKCYESSFEEYRKWLEGVFEGPDIRVLATESPDMMYVTSTAMKCAFLCKKNEVPKIIDDLTRDYFDLVSAGEIKPHCREDV